MKAVTKSWLPFAILAALTGACGDSGGSNDGEGNGGATAGTNTGDSAGGNTGSTAGGNTGNTAGGNTGSTAGGNTGSTAGGNTGTDADAGTSAGGNAGDGGNGLPAASECGAQANGLPLDSTAAGGCYYFYCYQTEDSLLAASTQGGACANATDVAIQCEGTSVREVAECSRQRSFELVAGQKQPVVDCVRKNAALAEFSDACLDCNIESARCAALNCLMVCINGDSPECDQCRQNNGCTPDFYACAGLPDPMM